MTVAPPVEPVLPPPRRPWGIVVLVGVVVVVIGYLAFSSVGNALVYYVTPTELLDRGDDAIDTTVRLGGMVLDGSIVQADDPYDLTFVLTDGDERIAVHTTTAPTASFREGSGAVVEGRLGIDGVFQATQVIVKHDENYVAPEPGALPSDRNFIPGEDS
ncbi:MAG TPA: cytochrome c maturation protein CcmE [Candidatus Limnocylindria bacterium]|jgi:cytochrome c-type biogenesis protein CcmE